MRNEIKPFNFIGMEKDGLGKDEPDLTYIEIEGANHVTVVTHTPDPDLVVAVAASTCYSHDDPITLYEKLEADPERVERVITRCVKSGHLSVLEHASITFAISKVSRSFLAQITRHRIASFSVQSMRYVDMAELKGDDFICPPINGSEPDVMHNYFKDKYKESVDWYRFLENEGIPNEDARYVLPEGTPTNMVVTMNLREILHFCGLRCCYRAQYEIRKVASIIARYSKHIAPISLAKCGPKCEQLGYCNESSGSCGRKPTLGDLEYAYYND